MRRNEAAAYDSLGGGVARLTRDAYPPRGSTAERMRDNLYYGSSLKLSRTEMERPPCGVLQPAFTHCFS